MAQKIEWYHPLPQAHFFMSKNYTFRIFHWSNTEKPWELYDLDCSLGYFDMLYEAKNAAQEYIDDGAVVFPDENPRDEATLKKAFEALWENHRHEVEGA